MIAFCPSFDSVLNPSLHTHTFLQAKDFLFAFLICVYTRSHMGVEAGICQEHIWRKEDKSGCRSSILFEVESLVQHYWEASGRTSSQGSSCLHLLTSHSNAVIPGMGFCLWIFTDVLGIQTQVVTLLWQEIYLLSHLCSSQGLCNLSPFFVWFTAPTSNEPCKLYHNLQL